MHEIAGAKTETQSPQAQLIQMATAHRVSCATASETRCVPQRRIYCGNQSHRIQQRLMR